MLLYHTGYQEIPRPDVRYGRKNADFCQGFYTTPDRDFALRWARERRGVPTVLNTYELRTEGLCIRYWERGADWYDYLHDNRAGRPDALPEADVVIGPIANDTLYDTLGIITSGFLTRKQATELLQLGPEYRQAVLKTDRAAEKLRWLSGEIISPEEIERCRAVVAEEERSYQTAFAALLEKIT